MFLALVNSTATASTTMVTTSTVSIIKIGNSYMSTDPTITHSQGSIGSIVTSSYFLHIASTTMILIVFNSAAAGTQSSSDDDGSSVGIISGCVIGAVLCITLLLVMIVLLWCYLRRRKGKLDVSQGQVK